MSIRTCLMTALLLTHMSSWAWDEERGVPSPKLTGNLPSALNIERVDVTLAGHHVTLRYDARIQNRALRQFTLSKYGHVFGWQGVAADYPDQHYPEMSLMADGQLLRPKHKVTAFMDGEEITAALMRAGIDPLRVAKGEDALIDINQHTSKSVRRLFSSTQGLAFPLWQVSSHQTWRLPVMHQNRVMIEVAYTARPAKFEVDTNSQQFESLVLKHCGNLQQFREVTRSRQGSLPTSVVVRIIDIPLSLGNMPPVDTFLTIPHTPTSAESPARTVSFTCGPEETVLIGTPFVLHEKTATGTSLPVLELTLP